MLDPIYLSSQNIPGDFDGQMVTAHAPGMTYTTDGEVTADWQATTVRLWMTWNGSEPAVPRPSDEDIDGFIDSYNASGQAHNRRFIDRSEYPGDSEMNDPAYIDLLFREDR